MSKSEYTLTRFLWSATSGLGKITTLFMIFSLIVGGYALADANIQNYRTTVDSGNTMNYTIDTTKFGDLQVAIFANDPAYHYDRNNDFDHKLGENNPNPLLMDISVVNVKTGDVVYRSSVYNGHALNLQVEKGTYKVVVTNSSDKNIEIFIFNSQMDIKAFWLAVVLISLFGISFSLLMSLLPFLIFALIFRAVSKTIPSENNVTEKSTSVDQVPSEQKWRNQRIQTRSSRRELLESNPGSMLIDVTNKDKLFASIALFFAIASILNRGGSFFFFLFAIIVVIDVTRRNSIRIKLTNLLYQRGSLSISEAASSLLMKRTKHLVRTLNYMMLELGYPINFNTMTGIIEVTGDLTPYLTYVPQTVANTFSQEVKVDTPVTKAPKEDMSSKVPEMIEKVEKTSYTNCKACGSELPSSSAYCHNCGARQN